MLVSRDAVTFTVVQLGALQRAEADNAVGLANLLQRGVRFQLYPQHFALQTKRYRLANGGFDLGVAAARITKEHELPRPLIFLTSMPYGDRHSAQEPEYYFFADYALGFDPRVCIISTYLWERLRGDRPIQPYLLLSFATAILSLQAGLEFHDETRGCLFDYCDEPADIDAAMASQWLCDPCERFLEASDISLEQNASARRLYNRAVDRKVCFMVMPFLPRLRPVYRVVQKTLSDQGWAVVRADEMARPRRITDAILHAILASDLVVADITGGNPNVFYEVGVAHAVGRDVILLTQHRTIPFDIRTQRAIRYKPTVAGLRALARDLGKLTGGGPSGSNLNSPSSSGSRSGSSRGRDAPPTLGGPRANVSGRRLRGGGRCG